MGVNANHPEYSAAAGVWQRAREVLAGEDAVKAAGERLLKRVEGMDDTEYQGYLGRASFFNATARTRDGYLGLIYRRAPFIRVPELVVEKGVAKTELRSASGLGGLTRALREFVNDADMRGTSLYGYAKNVVNEVISVGRAGTLMDWEGGSENRAYASLYLAEQIINWRVERLEGRNELSLVVLKECVPSGGGDFFSPEMTDQIRVLRLVAAAGDQGRGGTRPYRCVVDIWRAVASAVPGGKPEWVLAETRVPLRLGRPLPGIPFVFHGPRHSRPDVDVLPLQDLIGVNLDHYRVNAEFKHGLHFTALPTAWVSGFPSSGGKLKMGSSVAWQSETAGASAGFLEYTGQGLMTFERTLDRAERQMAVLGSRLLEDQKKVGETAEAIQLRQSGENSILGSLSTSVSESLTRVLRWAYWWNSTADLPEKVEDGQALVELNTDFTISGMTSLEVTALVGAWQAGGISRDTLLDLFRKGEILPDGRTNQDELALILAESGKRKAESGNLNGTNGTNGGGGSGGQSSVIGNQSREPAVTGNQ